MISKGNHDLIFTSVTDIAQVSQDVQVAHNKHHTKRKFGKVTDLKVCKNLISPMRLE